MTGLRGRKVLIVEDEWFLADDAARAIEAAGASVVGPAADEAEALALIAAGGFDLAVLDVNLGDGAGFRVAEALAAKDVPFVFATGYDRSAVPVAFAGAPRLEKPYDPRRLAAVLEAAFRRVWPACGDGS